MPPLKGEVPGRVACRGDSRIARFPGPLHAPRLPPCMSLRGPARGRGNPHPLVGAGVLDGTLWGNKQITRNIRRNRSVLRIRRIFCKYSPAAARAVEDARPYGEAGRACVPHPSQRQAKRLRAERAAITHSTIATGYVPCRTIATTGPVLLHRSIALALFSLWSPRTVSLFAQDRKEKWVLNTRSSVTANRKRGSGLPRQCAHLSERPNLFDLANANLHLRRARNDVQRGAGVRVGTVGSCPQNHTTKTSLPKQAGFVYDLMDADQAWASK